MPHDVFISYATPDAAVAKRVCQLLESRQLACWMAPRDILAGQEWAVAVVEAIRNARALVLVFSEHANTSPAIRRELDRAFSFGIPVLPLRIKEVEPSGGVALYIATVHWIDAFTPPIDAQIGRLADGILALLGRTVTESAPATEVRPAGQQVPSDTAEPAPAGRVQMVPAPAARSAWRRRRLMTLAVAALLVMAIGLAIVGSRFVNRHPREDAEVPALPDQSPVAPAEAASPAGPSPLAPPSDAEPDIPPEFRRLLPLHRLLEEPTADQSYTAYLDSQPTTPTGKSWRIYVQPLGDFQLAERKIVDLTGKYLGILCDLPVDMLPDLPLGELPESARRTVAEGRQQLSAIHLLNELLPPHKPQDAALYVAFTTSDLWPGKGAYDDWNYCFGQATWHNRVGVWSLYRYGDPGENSTSFRTCLSRTLKISAGLSGTMFSLDGCGTYHCNMNQSMSVGELDLLPMWLCPRCHAKLCWATKVDPQKQLSRLIAFCQDQDLKAEQAFFEKSLQVIRDGEQ